MRIKVLAVVLSLLLAPLAVASDYLTEAEILELFNNKTADIYLVDRGNKKVVSYTEEGGKRLLLITWKDVVKKRKWWTEGDKVCGSHPKRGDFCRSIKKVSDNEYHAYEDGEHLRTLKNFRDGNQID